MTVTLADIRAANFRQNFQACVGPSGNKVHVAQLNQHDQMLDLVLCETTAAARKYRADIVVGHPALCKRCWKIAWKKIGHEPEAADVGVTIIMRMP